MIIEPESIGKIEIKPGVRTVIRTKQSFKFVIETIAGTIVEGTATANTPLAITPSNDIKNINIILDEDTVKPISLVE
ncbi:MAG: hypothetical protein Q8M54_12355 [Desulfobaccales bacterium]|nr:hypothetical protein [Desulfobaccales bacterium]